MKDEMTGFSALLLEHFLKYQMGQGRVIQQKEFAEYVGIDDKYYNHIFHGRRKPSKAVVKLLAEFFNDLRFYDEVGMLRPDPEVHYIQRNWQNVPKKVRKEILEKVGLYETNKDE